MYNFNGMGAIITNVRERNPLIYPDWPLWSNSHAAWCRVMKAPNALSFYYELNALVQQLSAGSGVIPPRQTASFLGIARRQWSYDLTPGSVLPSDQPLHCGAYTVTVPAASWGMSGPDTTLFTRWSNFLRVPEAAALMFKYIGIWKQMGLIGGAESLGFRTQAISFRGYDGFGGCYC